MADKVEPTGIPTIAATDNDRVEYDVAAKAFCDKRKVAYKQFNQDMNAFVILNEFEAVQGKIEDVAARTRLLRLCKLFGNASAEKNRLSATKSAKMADPEVVESMLALLDA